MKISDPIRPSLFSRTVPPACAALIAAALAATLTGCLNLPPNLLGSSRGPLVKETLIPAEGYFVRDQILMLDVTGVIGSESASGGILGGGGPGALVELKDRLTEAEIDPAVCAVVVRIDSPGGGVTASDLIHHELLEFKRRKQEREGRPVPVVAMMQDIAASGGFYAAMAADEIYALPTTITGSVGVITVLPGLQGLTDKLGIEMRVIKSGANKDVGSPWRELSDSDQAMLQQMIDTLYERFLSVIMEARGPKGLTMEHLRAVADGRVLNAKEAVDAGLIDKVGYMEDAIARAAELAGVSDAEVVSYQYPYTYRGNFYASASAPAPKFSMGSQLNVLSPSISLPGLAPGGAKFLYMWAP